MALAISLPDSRPPASVGRSARVELVFARRGARTILAHAYAEPPFRVGPCLDAGGAAHVILVSSGPGIFAGDSMQVSVEVGAGARVLLTSQSALQVHPSPADAPAAVHHRYTLAEGAELLCHWDPVIPFEGARLAQRVDITMPDTARLYWSDAVMSGRVSRGETWRFLELAHELRLRIGGALRYLERYRLSPAEPPEAPRWSRGDAQYFGTWIVHHDRASAEHGAALQRRLDAIEGLRVGVDLVEARLLVARLMAAGGVPFATGRTVARQAALDVIFETPRLAGRGSV